MTARRIIDTHHHLWDLAFLRYPWLTDHIEPRPYGDYSSIRCNYLVTDLLKEVDETPVTRSIHLGANSDSRKETAWLQQIADDKATSRGFPHAIVPKADLLSQTLVEDLEFFAAHDNVRGIRQILSAAVMYGAAAIPTSGEWTRAMSHVEKHGFSCDLQVLPSQMSSVYATIADHSNMSFIIDHSGMVNFRDAESLTVWRRGIKHLADLPNVHMKISGFMLTNLAWTADDVRPVTHEMLDIFGIDRCFFGSNFPIDRIFTSYKSMWEKFEDSISDLSEDDKDKLFYRNAAKIYRIE
jgi:predicted TIM-barrel fold metal-dependent hydrolase